MQLRLTGNIHIIAGDSLTTATLISWLKSLNLLPENTADQYIRTYSHFGIDDAHEVNARSRTKALGSSRLFVIVSPIFTNEAQNALLKTIEESNMSTQFFFIVPSPHMLLHTIRSRAQIGTLGNKIITTQSVINGESFLASSPSVRIEVLKLLLDKGDNNKRDMSSILQFLNEIEHRAESIVDKNLSYALLREVYATRRYLSDKGALVKVLLERLALRAPIIPKHVV